MNHGLHNPSDNPLETFTSFNDAPEYPPLANGHRIEPRINYKGVWVAFDYETLIPANADNQRRSPIPFSHYITARILCRDCGREFTFSAQEQQRVYEQEGYHPDYFPKRCDECYQRHFRRKHLWRRYDANITDALTTTRLDPKQGMIQTIDELESLDGELPEKMRVRRSQLVNQLAKPQDND